MTAEDVLEAGSACRWSRRYVSKLLAEHGTEIAELDAEIPAADYYVGATILRWLGY